jgi:hypothetical protein
VDDGGERDFEFGRNRDEELIWTHAENNDCC